MIINAKEKYPDLYAWIHGEGDDYNAIGGEFLICFNCGEIILFDSFYKDGYWPRILCEECWNKEYPDKSEWEKLYEEDDESFYCSDNESDPSYDSPLWDIYEICKKEYANGNKIDWR